MNLPTDFLVKMQELLQEEFDDFIKSYKQKQTHGLRVNTLKIERTDFSDIQPFELKKIPWVTGGFYYPDEERPGKHPFHDAGLYYIQEPSAMAVGELVDAKPGEKVLDLCAAPGGKTTHIAAQMEQQGILVANEIHPNRAKILSQNIERFGVKNAIVTNESPEQLSRFFPSYFDRILVDAPCSGEGMFRKHPEARNEWTLDSVEQCSIRQQEILDYAATMLQRGGRLVYSTCTFSPEENELVISRFLKKYPSFEIEEIQAYEGFSHGRPDWISEADENIQHTFRLWPHKLYGEGHYIAVLRKTDGKEMRKRKYAQPMRNRGDLKYFSQFCNEVLEMKLERNLTTFGSQLYQIPEDMLSLEGLRVLRPGLHLGTLKKNRFEPSHALALALKETEVKYVWNLDQHSDEVRAYLKGETLKGEGKKGRYLVQVNGYSLGWGKLANGLLKNHYPKGLRWKVF